MATSLALDAKNDWNNYSKIYITKQFDPFRIGHCFEAPNRYYIIYGVTQEGDKKILFNAIK